MSGPGSGRYTKYVPTASDRNTRLSKLFNKRAGDQGAIYGVADQFDLAAAAAAAVKTAIDPDKGLFPSDGTQVGDIDMFPKAVNLNFSDAPNVKEVKWTKAGDPANAYVPDLSSPGPKKTSGTDKNSNPEIAARDVKPDYLVGVAGSGTESPSDASPKLGGAPIGKKLEMGKSSIPTS